jgi:16S rRNA (guanine527-N7)-methyltransferase
MPDSLEAILNTGAREFGLAVSSDMAAQFARYYALLTERNRVVNLTAISGEYETATAHFLDSLAPLTLPCMRAAAKGARVCDVGSGAGFPGVPLRIAAPPLAVTLLDGQQKRVAFLAELCVALGLTDVTRVHARAEDYARGAARGSFDFVLSRAVASLAVLCELCLPLVRTGGYFIAMKGVASDAEIGASLSILPAFGAAAAPEIHDYTIPHTDTAHRLIVIQKTSDTTAQYPRRYARILRRPLNNRGNAAL